MTRNVGPGPAHRSETTSSASPVAARPGRSFGARGSARPLAGLATVVAIGLIFALAVALFRGSFTKTEPITLISDRAGLVMNPDAKVKMRGVQVGTVSSIEQRPDGKAVLHLAMNPAQLRLIPGNVQADIASTTVFGAKYVQLVAPDNPSSEKLRPGQTLQGDHVTVEMNTVFQQLTNVLDKIDPAKLNETLGALSSAFSGRGEAMGQSLSDFNAVLKKIEPSLPNLTGDIESMAAVSRAYGDAAPDLLKTVENTNKLSDSIVAEQNNLDNFLVSSIGLADTGNEVIGGNRQALSTTLNLLAPTTDLLNEYAPGIECGLKGMNYMAHTPPQPEPGVVVNVAFTLGIERYRYPQNLPKVAAKGGPHCMGLPYIGFGNKSKYLVMDTNANPWKYGNQGILLNSDGLKQMLFGPLDGPPRNTMQIGQPG
ncbi:MCE-family protein [Mycolicibacterium sp. (ex Dasyatis americana)]|uniref:MCE-family protein n=1 Tax=Mycobacterium syngnathidarum TaxID=1908205 RepID=A0A1Q9W549_9MYCO|nr:MULTISPECIES: MCE family protein [Mycobacterium]OFB36964.1 MCE-family protein [Mycolicibacterium sp. (ex Dasyatis americana)]MCG7608992.1 MCE family protein [Mycobacterium sp. CnD-18-1]OHU00013.1 MCE-family protein [Mycobacterium syngnathidarum]OLT90157.1 MCE-family protein [Mycobacterium syngnathidarum]TMS49665.1 MCE family protein [Mycobacterium sp. DBP42]